MQVKPNLDTERKIIVHRMRKYIYFIILFSFIFPNRNQFAFTGSSGTQSTISLQSSIEIRQVIDGYSRIAKEGEGHTTELGLPELPTFTTFYQLDPQKTYRYELEIVDSYIIEDINIIPHQGVSSKWEVNTISEINSDYYLSDESYPAQNLVISDRLSGRGIEMITIQVTPYTYHPSSQKLEVMNQVNIHIIEDGKNPGGYLTQPIKSRIFEQLYKSLIINFESSTREEDYQQPAILYICGGNSETNSDFKNLLDWRRQRGYIVYTASISETGSSSSSIKNYIQNAYHTFSPPPEYVALLGDVDGSYSVATYYDGHGHNSYGNECEGDHPYSQLDGTDLIPEVLIGRMSIRTSSELSVVSSKIINYEKATYLGYLDDYFERAAMAGDPSSSGNSCTITKEYVAELLDAHGIDDIRLKTSGSSWSSWMENQLEEGVLFFNYRGYLGMSGFSTGNVDNANNGYKLPFATVLTCGTGSFAEDQTTMSEKFFRAGTASNPKGAVAAIGTATWNTHTLFNNIMDMGIYDGLFADDVETAGAALASGKLVLLNTYPTNPDDWVSAFTQWNNLMGDPATHLWTDTPVILSVSHTSEISDGTNFIDIVVQDENGNNIDGALITLWNRLITTPMNIFSNDMGEATIDLSGLSATSYTITVTKNNYQPYSGVVNVISSGAILSVDEPNMVLDDHLGNDDGNLNPGETVYLTIPIINNGTEELSGVSATLTAASELITITSSAVEYGTVNIGETSSGDFGFTLSPAAVHSEDLGLRLLISDDASTQWEAEIRIDVIGSLLVVNGNGYVETGLTSSLNISLMNMGQQSESNIYAELSYSGSQVTIEDNYGSWENLSPGESGNSLDDFEITAGNDIVNGTILPLSLHIQSDDGYDRIEILNVQIGEVSVIDPLGPDEYGYYIYDSGDEGYDLSPVYDWVEIDPSSGGNGTDLNLSNSGNGNWSGNGPISHVDLPFPFKFYGIDYDEITVCTNGWIAFGFTDMESFRNYSVPGAGGPSPMLAAFWDDLETTSSGDVFTYFDSNNDYFIIEWSDMRTHSYNSLETFQIILFNDGSQPYGDGNINIQYKVFNNTSSFINQYPPIHGSYATIGIENHLGDQGLQYSYDNQYPEAAMVLDDETSLYITTSPPVSQPSPQLSYTPDNLDIVLNQGESASSYMTISNIGEEGSVLSYSVSKSGISPFEVSGGGPDDFGYLWSDSEIEDAAEYNWVDIADMGNQLSFPHNDIAADPVDMGFEFPFYGQGYTQCIINPNGWVGFGEDNTAFSNSSIPAASAPQPAIFGFWDDLNPISSDQGGCPSGSGNVYTSSDNDMFIIWFDHVSRCASGDGVTGTYDFQFVLHDNGDIDINYGDMSGYTTSATIGMQNGTGLDGLQVTYNNAYVQSQLSLKYRMSDDANWLSLSGNLSGDLVYGESTDIDIIAQASDLTVGEYSGEITIASNSQSVVTIPVSLLVLDNGLLGDVNGDGILNVLDVVTLVNIILNNDDYILAGDMNQDGALDVLDIVTLVNIILS